ncbi:toll-like receptor 10 isoform X2 [Lucilia sericata]|uniref:toll-like receptor 10 isoform X2 n=1 Tax=Lucilia sericata TaxID=13632 RepID=UPI0018A8291D|nr:toll-like receptor 10 isoform X2 [Lucilia sericata]
MPYNYLILKILLVIYTFYIKQIQCNELCWNNDEECTIKTELFKNLELSHGITMQIDCHFNLKENNAQDHLQQTEEENDFQTSTKNRFMGIQTVMLDGCQTPLNALTYGLEFLPICKYITKVSIRHFHMDILRPLHCQAENSQQLQLEYLNIQFNEIAAIEADSFVANTPQLRDVLIEKNSLKLIHKDAFKAIRSLENLYIVNEPVLMLKFPDLFEYTSVASVHLEALKQMTSGIFKHLPETLQNLYVANTPFDNVALLLRNSLVLRNLTIKHCALEKFTLHDVHSTVKRIDLSGNVMKTFTAYENKLNELNLSNNQLQWLPFEWLANLSNLECLILTGNHIKFLHLDNLLKSLPNVSLFDLSQNQLQSLQGYDNVIPDVVLSQVRIKCDQNPWDCLWLHEFAHYQPEKFRILQYEKFISKINVNGLQCIPSEKIPTTPAITTNNATQRENTAITPDHFLNVSTYTLVYGSPWEFKRNQRAEALIIVFMLPLGFSCMQTPANHPSQRFDVVRQLPLPTLQTETRRPLTQIVDGTEMAYEVPINGIVSECNCIALHSDDTPTAKCEKSVHITYEQLPTEEPPSQIYEEII